MLSTTHRDANEEGTGIMDYAATVKSQCESLKPRSTTFNTACNLDSWIMSFSSILDGSDSNEDHIHNLVHQQLVQAWNEELRASNNLQALKKVDNSEILQSYITLRDFVHSNAAPNKELMHRIRLQVAMRVELWALVGDTFVRNYSKLTRQKAKKESKVSNKSGEEIIIEDMVRILQLAAFLLPPETTFRSFLKQALGIASLSPSSNPKRSSKITPSPRSKLQGSQNKKIRWSRKMMVERIFADFELPSPYLQRSPLKVTGVNASALENLDLSPPRKTKSSKKRSRQDVSKPSDSQQNPDSNNKDSMKTEETEKKIPLLPKSVNLTAPVAQRKNTLLDKNSRSKFVGSHFNTNLSNAGLLFRQVTTTTKKSMIKPKPKTTPTAQTASKPIQSNQAANNVKMARKDSNSRRVMITETLPLKKATIQTNLRRPSTSVKTKPLSQMCLFSTTIDETPRKPAAPRAIMTAVTVAQATSKNMDDSPPMTSDVVAQAFRSVQQRHNRHQSRR